VITFLQKTINTTIEFFYPPFKKIMSMQLFKYAACGSFVMAIDFAIYFITYQFILNERNFAIGFTTLSPHVASISLSFLCSFPIGFFLQRNITFSGSSLRGRVQLFRYLVIVAICFALNIFFIKLFIEYYDMNAIMAKLLTIVLVVTFSYFTQKHYSFKAA
jgi:putative flippase GtrA